jgi:hypothetical protein
VEVAGGDTIFPSHSDELHPKTPAPELAKKAADTVATEVFKPTLSEALIWALRILIQLILMHLRTPPSIKMLPHTAHADTKLVPGIEALLKMAPAIMEEDPRALKGLDLSAMAERKELLLKYREVLDVLKLGAHCVEAGVTHLEQSLDGDARKVYPDVADLMRDNYDLHQQLAPLRSLVTDPVEQGQKTKKANQKVAAGQAEAEAVVGAGTPGGPGPAAPVPGATPTPGVAPTPAVVVTPQPAAVARPRAGRSPRRGGRASPRRRE